MGTSVFIIPQELVKNLEDRLVILNRTAAQVVEAQRGTHATHVFSFRGKPVGRMYASAWRDGRIRAGIPDLRVHDLKHTCLVAGSGRQACHSRTGRTCWAIGARGLRHIIHRLNSSI